MATMALSAPFSRKAPLGSWNSKLEPFKLLFKAIAKSGQVRPCYGPGCVK
ncbi:hypothetical protein SOVF_059850 [Spinacia oleracea]|nr:hypothetical protein SOVF_059850 [Spinacia oleracea]